MARAIGRFLTSGEVPTCRLVLYAHLGVLGVLRVEFCLRQDDGGTTLVADERPRTGAVARTEVAVVEGLLTVRNRVMSRCFARLVAHREEVRRTVVGDGRPRAASPVSPSPGAPASTSGPSGPAADG